MDSAELNEKAIHELDRIERSVQRAADAAGVAIEGSRIPDRILSFYREGELIMVINVQPATGRLFVSGRRLDDNFRPEGDRWVSKIDGAEIYAVLSDLLSRLTGTTLSLSP
ncbi:frataxin domain-containing protein [Spirillospora sp. CA-255316]